MISGGGLPQEVGGEEEGERRWVVGERKRHRKALGHTDSNQDCSSREVRQRAKEGEPSMREGQGAGRSR